MEKTGYQEPARIIWRVVSEHCETIGEPDLCGWLAQKVLFYSRHTVQRRFQRNDWAWSELLDIQKYFSSRRINDVLINELEHILKEKPQ